MGNGVLTSVTLGNSVATIGGSAFKDSGLVNVTIPDSVVSIGDQAFKNNAVTSATIGNSVTSIGEGAFYDNHLTSMSIPDSVTTIGDDAFAGNALTSVTLGTGVATIGASAFANATLTSVLLSGAAPSITAAGDRGSFGTGTGLTVYYPAAQAVGYGTPWNGYTAARLNTFTTSATPTIVGPAKVGQTLSADAGSWSSTPALNYAWRQVGSAAVLGTNSTYLPVATDAGTTLTVTVTATKLGYQTVALTSIATSAVALGTFTTTPTPVISGTKQVGKVLLADAGEWPDDAVLTYAWKRVGSSGVLGTSFRYSPVAGDVGKKLTVTVTATLAGYTTVPKTSAATTIVVVGVFASTPVPTISGTKVSGQTLTAVTGTWASGVTFTYVWKRASAATGTATAISGATARTYALGTSDKGKYITVTVVASKSGYTVSTQTSVVAHVAS